MRPGWNPTRRNRNIGTKARGHGADNRLVIPDSWHQMTRFYERLEDYVFVKRMIGAREILFFVEPPRPDWFYPCTLDDICTVLQRCSPKDIEAFDFIVLRQPTRKQKILSPVWGRAIFYFDISTYHGAAIVLEAQNTKPILWVKSLQPESVRELERLRGDGHEIRNTRKGIELHVTPNTLRNTILYRTLLHEVGHHVDYQRHSDQEWKGRTSMVKEDFAHRYACETFERLQRNGDVPFSTKLDPQSLQEDGLRAEWFCP